MIRVEMVGLQVDIWEGDDENPILTHVFWGKTQKEAEQVSEAHEKTDEFYRDAVQKGKWNDMELCVEKTWIKL